MKNHILLVVLFCATILAKQKDILIHLKSISIYSPIEENNLKHQLYSEVISIIDHTPTPQINGKGRKQNVDVGRSTKNLSNLSTVGKTYFISAKGNDGNNGLSMETAWKTVAKINGFQFNSDTIVLDGNLSGVIQFDVNDVSTPLNPIVVKSNTARAAIGGIFIYNIGGVEIHNVKVVGNGANSNTKDGIAVYKDNNAILSHIYIDSVETSGFGGRGIIVGAWNTSVGYDDVRITNVIAHNNGSCGIESYGYNDQYSHTNFYVGNCQAYQNYGVSSITTVPTGSGIVLSSVNGAMIEKCVAWGNGKNNRNATGGPVGIWFYNVKNGTIQHCESYQNQAGLHHDGGGFDIDGGCQNVTIQHCFSHDNEGAGYLVAEYGSSNSFIGNKIVNNVSTNDGLKNNSGSLRLWGVDNNHPIKDAIIENNLFFISTTTPAINFVDVNFSNVLIANNTFYVQPSTQQIQGSTGGVQLINNLFLTSGVLPVKLLSFDAQKNFAGVKLQWSASDEGELSYYEIEKSSLHNPYISIYKKAVILKDTLSQYNYLDANFSAAHSTYYRLRMISKNGKIAFSKIISVDTEDKSSGFKLAIMPNPVQDKVSINVTSSIKKDVKIRIVNSGGMVMLDKIINIKSGNNNVVFYETSKLPKGIYWLIVNSNDEQKNVQFIK